MNVPAWIPIIGPFFDRRKAHRELPELARRWNLRFIKNDNRYLFGSFEGTLQGYTVQIYPDTPSVSVKLGLETESFMLMTLDTGQKRHVHNLGYPRFEKVFKTMELSRRLADTLRGRVDVFDRVLALLHHRVTGILVSNQSLVCNMYNPFRRPRRRNIETANYITVPDLERLLPEMIEVVRLIESMLSSVKDSVQSSSREK